MRNAVYELQGYLRSISRYDEDIPFVASDGIFGKETTESVTAFQKKYGLEPTGRVNFVVWEKIKETGKGQGPGAEGQGVPSAQ